MHQRLSRSVLFLSCVSVLAFAPAAFAFMTDEVPQEMTFLPFLKRYVTLPADWLVKIEDTKATFHKEITIKTPASDTSSSSSSVSSRKKPSPSDRRAVRRARREGMVYEQPESSSSSSSSSSASPVTVTRVSHSFVIASFPTEECNVLDIQAMLARKYPGIKDEETFVNYERIPGAQAAGYSWMEKSGTERHICIIPAGRVGTSEVIVPVSDTATYEIVSKVVLQQLVKEVKRTRSR